MTDGLPRRLGSGPFQHRRVDSARLLGPLNAGEHLDIIERCMQVQQDELQPYLDLAKVRRVVGVQAEPEILQQLQDFFLP